MLDQKYDYLNWMKLSEIVRYWVAKELTNIAVSGNKITLKASFSSPGCTLKLNSSVRNSGIKIGEEEIKPLVRIKDIKALKSNTWYSDKTGSVLCFNLEKGLSELVL
jgi:hypothetical protein